MKHWCKTCSRLQNWMPVPSCLEKATENVADMMRDIELHFAYRARQEKKKIILSGSDYLSLFCDRDWLSEAIDNIVKNAFDHTESGAVNWHYMEGVAIRYSNCGKGQWMWHPPGRYIPYFQAFLSQPFFKRYTGYRSGPSAWRKQSLKHMEEPNRGRQ